MKTQELTPKVSVIMLAYNHEKYISDAIESIVNQQTNFPFELIIGEDCSTDNTVKIIKSYQKEYPKIIKLITSEKNVGIIANELRVMQQCQGKYIAFCEADDFWTDELKLQKQVDFLEENEEVGLVHADVNHWEQGKNKIEKAINRSENIKIPSGNIFEFLMLPSHSIKTMTVCMRKDIFELYYLNNNEIKAKDWFLIDISIWLTIAKHSKIQYFDEVFATYRLLDESMSRSKNKQKLYEFHQKIMAIKEYFLTKMLVSDDIKNQLIIHKYYTFFYDGFAMKNFDLMKKSKLELEKLSYSFTIKEKIMYYKTYFGL